MLPPVELINHDCFSKVKELIIHIEIYRKEDLENPNYVLILAGRIELKFFTEMKAEFDDFCSGS